MIDFNITIGRIQIIHYRAKNKEADHWYVYPVGSDKLLQILLYPVNSWRFLFKKAEWVDWGYYLPTMTIFIRNTHNL